MNMKKRNFRQNGFSLIELILVMGIMSIAFIGILSYISKLSEQMKAESAGEQFADIGKGLGNYISRESGSLLACIPAGTSIVNIPLGVLTTSVGTTVVGSCTLNNRQVLPATTSATNMFGTTYNISVQNSASGSLGGLVLSAAPIIDPGEPGVVRYDWIGMAMKKAGAQAGMTFTPTGANSLRGLGGGWALANTDYPGINQLGLFGYRVSYQGTYDDIYLRLDGAYPMRGDLNMGNYSIDNATDINFNGWLNGNNALLNNLKSGYISNSGNIQTNTATVTTSINTGGRESQPMPVDWGGDHIHTWDVYGNGTIGVGTGGLVAAYMRNDGLVGAKDVYLTTNQAVTGLGVDGRTPYNGYLSDRLPQYVSRGGAVVGDWTVVNKPICNASGGSGTARIIVTPQIQNTYGDYSVSVNIAPQANNSISWSVTKSAYTVDQIQVYAVDNGPSWTVHMTSSTGAAYGAISGYRGVAQVFCDFG